MRTREWVVLIIVIAAAFSFTFSYFSSLCYHRTTTKTVTVTETIELTPTATTLTPDEEYRESVQKLLQDVMKWVESHRGLRFKEEVDVVILTKEWVIEHWGIGFLNLTEVRLEEKILKSLFIIPRDFNLTKFKAGRAGYLIAASAGNKIYIVKEAFNPNERLRAGGILAHELMHVLQGEYFELPEPATSDERDALNALVEGDADLLSAHYISEHGGVKSNPLESYFDPLTALWLFPYIYGKPFVEYVYEKEGWSGVNALYENPPRSTAEVLHPEKYLEGWRPLKPSFSSKIGNGWKLMMQDTLGEYFIREMLRAHLSFFAANESAEGWRGDVIQLYEKGEAYLIRWKIVWENHEEAKEFTDAFRELLQKVGANETSTNIWTTATEVISIKASGTEVLIEIVSPPGEMMKEAVEAASPS